MKKIKSFIENKKEITKSRKFRFILSFFVLVCALALIITPIATKKVCKTYKEEGTVTEILVNDDNTYNIIFLIKGGHTFTIKTGETYAVGERYVITFNSKNTFRNTDDEIVKLYRPIN